MRKSIMILLSKISQLFQVIGNWVAHHLKKDAGKIFTDVVTGLLIVLSLTIISAVITTSFLMLKAGYQIAFHVQGRQINNSKYAIENTNFHNDNFGIYIKLRQVKIKTSLSKITELFGAADISHPLPSPSAKNRSTFPPEINMYTEWIYVDRKYVLQIISKDQQTVAFSITRRVEDFKPEIPYLYRPAEESTSVGNDGYEARNFTNYRLGDLSFRKLYDEHTNGRKYIHLGGSSKEEFYVESYYFGFPGYYNTFLFAWTSTYEISPAQHGYPNVADYLNGSLFKDDEKYKKFDEWRGQVSPNSFSIIEQGHDELLSYLIQNPGPVFYDVMEQLDR